MLSALQNAVFVAPDKALLDFCRGFFVLGIFLASYHESCVHQYLGHAKKRTRDFWLRHPWLFMPLIEGFFMHHVVHHGRTFRDDYLTKFGQSLNMAKLDEWAPEAFYRMFAPADQTYVRKRLPPAKLIAHLHAADYGLGAVSTVKFASTIFPLTIILFLLVPFWAAVGASLPMLIVFPAMSLFIHRHVMHVFQNEPGPPEKGKFLNWLRGSVCMKALEIWHWMHHEYIFCNFNLFVFADFFRGAWRKPSREDLEKMAREGLAMDIGIGMRLIQVFYVVLTVLWLLAAGSWIRQVFF